MLVTGSVGIVIDFDDRIGNILCLYLVQTSLHGGIAICGFISSYTTLDASSLSDLGNRRETVGKRGQICAHSRRIVGLFDEALA